MRITCPECNFSKEVPEEKIPLKATIVSCPRCGTRFPMQREPSAQGGFFREEEFVGSRREAFTEQVRGETSPPSYRERAGAGTEGDIPWESKSREGMLYSLFRTILQVMFTPRRFFSAMNPGGEKSYPISFLVIVGTVTLLISYFLQYSSLQAVIAKLDIPFPVWLGPFSIVLLALFIPIWLIVGLYIGTAVIHAGLVILRGNTYPFSATMKVLAYSSAVQMWSLIPYVGGVIASVWGLAVTIIGLSSVHSISKFKAFLSIIILSMIIALVGVIVAVAIPLLIAQVASRG